MIMIYYSKLQLTWILVIFIFIVAGVVSDEEFGDDFEDGSLSRSRFHHPSEDRPCQYRRREGVCRRRSECRRPTRHTCRHGMNPIVCCLDKDVRSTSTTTTFRPEIRRPPTSPPKPPSPKPDSIKNIDITFPDCGLRSPKVAEESNRLGNRGRPTGDRRGGLFSRLGKRDVNLHPRYKRQFGMAGKPVIVGGRESVSFSWPWMVAIFKVPSSGGTKRFLCGASLISQRYVLTAAHCFDSERTIDPSKYFLVVGSHTTKDGTEYTVENILIHPDYKKRQYYNDLTLMRVKGTVALNKKVFPVCLPSDGLRNKIKTGAGNVTVIGWGDTTFGGVNSKTLQEVVMPIVPLKECNASYSKIPLTNFPKGITNEFICAGYKEGGKDACQGDSGGPMTNELTDKAWVQLGIVSFGYGCARAGFPGVYTRMSHYTKWLYDNTDLGRK